MARTSKEANAPLADFVAALRQVRERDGNPTFATMSRRVDFSTATLCRTQSGARAPSLRATLAYVEACGGDLALWERQHRQLLRALRSNTPARFVPWQGYFDRRQGRQVAFPTVKLLAEEMRRLWEASGLTLAEIAKRTASVKIRAATGSPGISVSAVSDVCNPRLGRLPRRPTLHAFLLAVEADPSLILTWIGMRNRLSRGRRSHNPGPVTPTERPSPVGVARQLRPPLLPGQPPLFHVEGPSKATQEEAYRSIEDQVRRALPLNSESIQAAAWAVLAAIAKGEEPDRALSMRLDLHAIAVQ